MPNPRLQAALLAAASDDLNLTLASPHLNRNAKGAKDWSDWRPERNACWTAGRVVQVRAKWRLTVDRREADALRRTPSGCGSLDLRHGPNPNPAPPPDAGAPAACSASTSMRSRVASS